MKHFPVVSIVAAAIVCAWAPAAAHAQTTPSATSTTTTATTTSTTTATTTSTAVTPTREAESAYVARLQARYPTLASQSNLESLVHGLRTGSAITLAGSSTGAGGTTTAATTFTPPTRPMGYGNITRAMTLATRQLAAAGVTDPTPQQLQAALMGGSVATPTGTIETKGVLQLRSSGMGWGKIAHSIGVAPGMGSAATTAASGTRATAPATRTGITTAAGAPGAAAATKTTGREHSADIRGRGIVTAAGTGVSAMQYRNGSGPVAGTSLAANVSSGHGVVNGAGSGAAGAKAHGGRH